MDARLVGVHTVKATLASGKEVVYHYAWRGGPRIKAKPGTNAFVQEFARLTKARARAEKPETLGWLADQYLSSGDFQKLRPSTRTEYERIIAVIKVAWGDTPLRALEAKGMRTAFIDWRDSMSSTPRSADLHIAILARVIAWGKDREHVMRNPLERVGKLHNESRKDDVWLPSQLDKILREGRPHIANVIKMALWTMQRQSDVLTLTTMAYDDGRLWITQGKTRARVRIRPADELLPILQDAKDEKRQRVLVNSRGENWTSSGFRASLRKEMQRLKITGIRFHDLRGTGITYAYANGVEIERIAEISGHSKSECESIIRRNYLAGEGVIDAIRAGTKMQ
ncbi:tyrosine-type recombinase/integrase [Mesorhizobium sp. CAU 1741]|uniref:tyrosine-type recombinase/integrase n=1 Tax=Mesorhizobium sp. CAU 1741 TaxID=3140366 RepID=UPI00325BB0E6